MDDTTRALVAQVAAQGVVIDTLLSALLANTRPERRLQIVAALRVRGDDALDGLDLTFVGRETRADIREQADRAIFGMLDRAAGLMEGGRALPADARLPHSAG